jgi:transposase InsO family protein
VKGCTISRLCRLSAISRQAYYKEKRVRQRERIEEDLVLELVRRKRADHPRMGARKLLWEIGPELSRAGLSLGRDRFLEILRAHDLLVEPKRRSTRTTYSDHALPLYRNLLYELSPTAPNQVWVADITYLETDEGFVYLSLITDLFSRKIVGWNLGESLEAAQSVKALRHAIEELPEGHWPIHHSDRGSQYCCREYVEVLRSRDLPISMTEANHCYENCYAERVNGILKTEYHLDLRFRTKEQALKSTRQAVEMYNNYRPHSSLEMCKPAQIHRQVA